MKNAVQHYRTAAGLSKSALGRAIGCDHRYVARVEQGLVTPSVKLALRMEKALGVDIHELFQEEDAVSLTIQLSEADIKASAVFEPLAVRLVQRAVKEGMEEFRNASPGGEILATVAVEPPVVVPVDIVGVPITEMIDTTTPSTLDIMTPPDEEHLVGCHRSHCEEYACTTTPNVRCVKCGGEYP